MLNWLKTGDLAVVWELAPLISAELRRRVAGYLFKQPPGHTRQPTGLVTSMIARNGRCQAQFRTEPISAAVYLIRVMVIDRARVRCAVRRTPDGLPARRRR